jgi:hypothetical protein
MKSPTLAALFLAVFSSVAPLVPAAEAGNVSYAVGDLFLGFRATGGTGVTRDYLVNLGPASQFTVATSAFTVPGLNGIAADLTAIFGADWNIHRADASDVRWSISGTPGSAVVGGDAARTLFITTPQATPGTLAAPRTRANSSAQAAPTNKLTALAGAFLQVAGVQNSSTANSPVAIIQAATDANSYASFQTGDSSYSYFSPTIEGDFANGTAGSVLELYRLTPATGLTIGTPGDLVGTFTIDDNATLTFTPAAVISSATVYLENTQYSVSEADANQKVTVKVVRGGGLAGAFTVNFNTSNGAGASGATAPTDFTAQTNFAVSFAANETQKTVDVPIFNRTGFQGDRTFFVGLSGATAGATVVASASVPATILEADASVKFAATSYSVGEADGKVTLALTRGNGLTGSFTVNLSTVDGPAGAVAGTDYTGQANTQVSFGANDLTKTVDVIVANRPGLQGNRTFTATLSGVVGNAAVVAPGSTTVAITDLIMPGSVAFSAATYQTTEGASADVLQTITVSRTGGVDGAVSVDVALVNGGTATNGTDFTLPSSPVTLNWADNESGAKSFDITIKSDSVAEPTQETILLALQNATGGVSLGTPNTATVSIIDGDMTPPTVTLFTPKAGAKLTSASVTFTGSAKDNLGVGRVDVKLNGGAPQTATLSGPATDSNWTLTTAPEQGLNTVEVTAFDLLGNASTAITRTFTFVNLRPLLGGKYNGLLVASVGSATPLDHHGLVALKVTPTGTFTGKVTLSGVTLPIAGVFLTGGEARFGKTPTPSLELVKKTKPANTSLGFLALTLDTGGGNKITGTLKNGTGTSLADVPHADQALYNAKKKPVPATILDPTREKGKYTAIFQVNAAPNNGVAATGFPQGDGFGTVTISAAGVAKIVGKLADGSAITYANALSKTNQWPVFIPLYAKKGFVTGYVAFDPTQTQTDASGAGLKWFKPAGLPNQTIYPDGWPNGITTDFAASKFLAPVKPTAAVPNPPNPDTVLGPGAHGAASPGTANIEITTAFAAPATSTANDASLDAASKIAVLGATTGGTVASELKAAFVAKTGALSGSFIPAGASKPVKFNGVAYQKTNTAAGYFLLTPPTAPAGAAAQSGAVGVALK